jgi:hypothetical protein
MEQKIFWKNFLLLAVGGLLALHINVAPTENQLNEKDPSSYSFGRN